MESLSTKLTRVQAQLAILYTTYASLIATENESYATDTGEGSHRTQRRKLAEVRAEIDALEAKESQLIRALSGTGVSVMRVSLRGCPRC